MWTNEEDTDLLNAVDREGTDQWPRIAVVVGKGRSADECRRRYRELRASRSGGQFPTGLAIGSVILGLAGWGLRAMGAAQRKEADAIAEAPECSPTECHLVARGGVPALVVVRGTVGAVDERDTLQAEGIPRRAVLVREEVFLHSNVIKEKNKGKGDGDDGSTKYVTSSDSHVIRRKRRFEQSSVRKRPWAVADKSSSVRIGEGMPDPPEDATATRKYFFEDYGDRSRTQDPYGRRPSDTPQELFLGREIVTTAATLGSIVTVVGTLKIDSLTNTPKITAGLSGPAIVTIETAGALVRRLRATADVESGTGTAFLIVAAALAIGAILCTKK